MFKNKNRLKDKANRLYDKGAYSKAGKIYKEIYEIDPIKEKNMLLTAAQAYERGKDKEIAIELYIQAAKDYAKSGFFLKATATLKNVLELDPTHEEIQYLISDLYAKNGNLYGGTSKSVLIRKDSFLPEAELIDDDIIDDNLVEECNEEEEDCSNVITGKIIESGDEFRKKDITELEIKDPVEGKLSEIPLFSELDQDVFIEVINKIKIKKYRDKQLIIKEGDKSDAFYIISEGSVRVTKEIDDDEVELAILEKGSFFGEMAILGKGKRTASVEAIGDVELLLLSREIMKELIEKYSSIKKTLTQFYQNRLLYNVINASPFFANLPKDDKLGLLRNFLSQKVDAGKVLIEQDGYSKGLFIIVDGRVKVFRKVEFGKRQKIATVSRGAILGEISLLTGEKPKAYCVTETKTWFLRLPAKDFIKIKTFYPSIMEHLENLKNDRLYELEMLKKLNIGLY